ncbi:MAG: 3-keto-disaccharide hydrolase [Roseibacillus sp.]
MIRTLFLALSLSSILPAEEGWVSLFNGKDLTGWTPKIAGHPLGENTHDTFRVEDGILKCCYDKYPSFDKKFGHLYSNLAYSHYILRMEYKFEGKMMADAPHYVNLNSGVMLHSQPPQSMTLEQGFPVSIEFQFLADEGKGPRPTGNVCTPGTNIEYQGELTTQHIVKSSAENLPADQWVQIEVEVRGSDEVIHRVNGVEVLRYQKPQLDPEGRVVDSKALLAAGAPLLLSHGHIALQAEGQPVWFRNIELKPLEK